MMYIDLEECHGRPPKVIRSRVLEALKAKLRARDLDSYQDLYPQLRKAGIELCVLYSVVRVWTRRQARWWLSCIKQIQLELPVRHGDDPQVILAFSMAYPRKTLWSLLVHVGLTRFFKTRYGYEFRPEIAPDQPGEEIARRLAPIRREHVDNWCHHREVREHIEGIDTDLFLEPFAASRELPMDRVRKTITRVLTEHSRRRTAGEES
jgi:hypothetical protein